MNYKINFANVSIFLALALNLIYADCAEAQSIADTSRIDSSETVNEAGFNVSAFVRELETRTGKPIAELFNIAMQKANDGDNEAMFVVGMLYHFGIGTVRNDEKALKWLEKGTNSKDANTLLANMYIHGDGVKRDLSKAYYYFDRAAQLGDLNSLYSIGIMCRDGQGVAKDYRKAASFLALAAEKGHNPSKVALGELILNGYLGKPDYEKAFHIFFDAARSGYADGMVYVALMLSQGDGVEKDLEKAKFWADNAAKNGNIRAQEMLKELIVNK